MPRATVISTYYEPETGRYVSPPAEVDLPQDRFDRLVRARCVQGKPAARQAPAQVGAAETAAAGFRTGAQAAATRRRTRRTQETE